MTEFAVLYAPLQTYTRLRLPEVVDGNPQGCALVCTHSVKVLVAHNAATLMTSLFPVFPPGDHSIRATYTGPSTLKGGTAQVTYPVSKLCL